MSINNQKLLYSTYKSSLCTLTIIASNDALKGIWLENQRYYCWSIDDQLKEGSNSIINQTKLWLDDYFAGKNPSINKIKMEPEGSDFRKRVWKYLCDIPYGSVCTYGDLAQRLAKATQKKKMSAQAVGGAVGHNPISIIIPCHRVVGATGSLTGYGGGIKRKLWLLEHEGVDCSNFFIPKHSTAP